MLYVRLHLNSCIMAGLVRQKSYNLKPHVPACLLQPCNFFPCFEIKYPKFQYTFEAACCFSWSQPFWSQAEWCLQGIVIKGEEIHWCRHEHTLPLRLYFYRPLEICHVLSHSRHVALQGSASTYPTWDYSVKSYEHLAEPWGVLTKFNSNCNTFPAHPQKNTHYLQPSLYLSVRTLKKLWVKATCLLTENSKSQIPVISVWHCVHKAQAVWARSSYSYIFLSPSESNAQKTCTWAWNGFP